jgi:transcriptional regulator with XRE-family HTH domain
MIFSDLGFSMISSGQCRAARGLLDWSQQRLAEQSGVAPTTIRQLESGTHEVRRATLYVVCQAFHKAGVEFIDGNGGGPGVRLHESIDVPAKERARVTAEPDGVPNATKQLQFSLERDDSGAAESGSSGNSSDLLRRNP